MTPRMIKRSLDELAGRDADVGAALDQVGYPAPRNRAPGFGSLVDIILGQQVSAMAAAAIRARLRACCNPMTPDAFLALDEAVLRQVGLSGRKIEYGQGLARDILERRLDLDGLAALDDDEVIASLTAVRGLGRWSAEIYMLFALGRTDVWPADDLAIATATQKLKRLRKKPDRKRLERIAKPWQPWRGVAALFLWHYYKGAP
jgi:DNA-3-methyladenine glycosylase II